MQENLQITFADYLNREIPKFKFSKPIRLIELFSGIGAQAKALKNLNVNFEYWKTSEWEYHAVIAYKAVHCSKDNIDYSDGKSKEELVEYLLNKGISSDGKEPLKHRKLVKYKESLIRQIYNAYIATHNIGSVVSADYTDLEICDTDKYDYLLTYSFPCQDLSVAGKGLGMTKGTGTRSGLLWEVERLLKDCYEHNGQNGLPKLLLMENVPQIHNKKNKPDFDLWLEFLKSLGYNTYVGDLNAKDYGVAQNRNRCFAISILGDYSYEFPKPYPLEKCLEDYLEDEVDKRYYLNDTQLNTLLNTDFVQASFDRRVSDPEEVSPTLLARDYKDPKCVDLSD